jgi:hypothetical protein
MVPDGAGTGRGAELVPDEVGTGRGGVIQMDIGGHPPFPTGSKQFSGNFGNLLFLAVFTSGAVLRP